MTLERISISIGSLTDIDVTVKMEPPPRSRIEGSAALIIRTALSKFNSKAACQSLSEKSSNFPAGGPPALTSNLSTPPNSLSVILAHCCIDSGSDESSTEAKTDTPVSFRNCSAALSISASVRLPIEIEAHF